MNVKKNYFHSLTSEWKNLTKKKNIFDNLKSCPVCKKKKFTKIFEKFKTNFVICNFCSHVFINPFFKSKIINNHFKNSPTWKYWTKKVLETKIQKKIEKSKYSVGVKFIDSLKSTPTILDIGSATGNFLKISQSRGWLVEGIEPIPSLAKKLKKKFQFKIYNSNFEETEINKKYDIITCWASFEYSLNPKLFIKKIEKYLKPKGKVIFYISGNSNSLTMRILREKCVGFIFNRINYFNPKSLNYLLKKRFKRILIRSELDNIGLINNYLNYFKPYEYEKRNFKDLIFLNKKNFKSNHFGYKFLAIYEKK